MTHSTARISIHLGDNDAGDTFTARSVSLGKWRDQTRSKWVISAKIVGQSISFVIRIVCHLPQFAHLIAARQRCIWAIFATCLRFNRPDTFWPKLGVRVYSGWQNWFLWHSHLNRNWKENRVIYFVAGWKI